MVKDIKEPYYRIIKDDVYHQGINGKEIRIEKSMTLNDVISINTIAAYNFINRRSDLIKSGILNTLIDNDIKNIEEGEYTLDDFEKNDFFDNFQVYYGHVGGLGYFIAEDELK